jgi:hypothetical protein
MNLDVQQRCEAPGLTGDRLMPMGACRSLFVRFFSVVSEMDTIASTAHCSRSLELDNAYEPGLEIFKITYGSV